MTELRTFGISPRTYWKLFEHEGYQVLAHVSEHPDDDEAVDLVLEGVIPELNEFGTTTLRLGNGNPETAAKIFDALDDPEKVIQTFLDNAGPAAQAMLGTAELPDDLQVDRVKFKDGTELRRPD